jgi:hypothetical protein
MRGMFGSRRSAAVAALATAVMAMGLSASAASATTVPAKWTTTGTARVSGTLNLTLNGTNPKTCTISKTSGEVTNLGSEGLLWGSFPIQAFCGGGPPDLTITFGYLARFDSTLGYELEMSENGTRESPYGGEYLEGPYLVRFTNGAGGTLSTFTYKETVIGKTSLGVPIKASGTISLDNGSTGTRTLTH